MRRREFIGLASGLAVAWPIAAHSQEAGSIKHVGYLTLASGQSEHQSGAFEGGLQELGYRLGRNLCVPTS
jgi:hypothetical protein